VQWLGSSSIIGWKTVSRFSSVHVWRMCAAKSISWSQPVMCSSRRVQPPLVEGPGGATAGGGDSAPLRRLNRVQELVGGARGREALRRAGGVRGFYLVRDECCPQEDGKGVRKRLVHELGESNLVTSGQPLSDEDHVRLIRGHQLERGPAVERVSDGVDSWIAVEHEHEGFGDKAALYCDDEPEAPGRSPAAPAFDPRGVGDAVVVFEA